MFSVNLHILQMSTSAIRWEVKRWPHVVTTMSSAWGKRCCLHENVSLEAQFVAAHSPTDLSDSIGSVLDLQSLITGSILTKIGGFFWAREKP